ncbi:class I SAM-dependent methyltransferase [Prosthecobacter sp.]|uniref:class I SAM-dependent methyltransferase n=1 Tax=Prosthecobacter sp. TaxID=1965333 RepID=UPI0024875488|nr:class I SAM-dependent methyltransferase [Prosthecobacter sp.]MDI1310849.1 class I SAM-dependent methyltransferase [Prosthecobacter sp.]
MAIDQAVDFGKPNVELCHSMHKPSLRNDREQSRLSINQFITAQAVSRLTAGMKVLDAGSGNLSEQTFRLEILASGATLTTCDAKANEGVDHVVDLHALPFPDAEFDLLLCVQVLEHIRNPDHVCAEFYRVLKPGGVAIVTVPQITHTLTDGAPPHYFNFTRYALETCLTDAGFKTIALESQGGAFCVAAHMLHYTVPVIRESKIPRLLKTIVVPVCRVMFGLVLKTFFKAIDHLDTKQRSSLGWNICVSKPATP